MKKICNYPDSAKSWPSDQIEQPGKNVTIWPECKAHSWRKPGTAHHPLTPSPPWGMGVSASCFSAAGTGRLVRINRTMNGSKYRQILDENLHQSANDLKLWRRFTFQQDNDPKHTANEMLELLQNKNVRHWIAQPKPRLESHLIYQSLRKSARIPDVQSWYSIPKTTQCYNRCQTCFYKVLTQGWE